MNIKLPENVLNILRILKENDREGFAVGGCIRDLLMGIEPHDYDITTDATPEEIRQFFNDYKVIDTGIKHGTVTVRMNGHNYEVTTYRTESAYSDHRHPDHVFYSKSIKDDLSRRDFTINAMAYNPDKGLIDLFDGRRDLRKGVIRTVGNASERFEEDALRILRAIRFAGRYDFTIDQKTSEAILQKSSLLAFVSSERILSEFNGILLCQHPSQYLITYKTVFLQFLPELDISDDELKMLDKLNCDLITRWGFLFSDESQSNIILKRLHADSDTVSKVTQLARYSNLHINNDIDFLNLLIETGHQQMDRLLEIWKAKNDDPDIDRLSAWNHQFADAPLSVSELAINGNDLLELGYAGKDIGNILHDLLIETGLGSISNQHEELIEHVKKTAQVPN